LNLWRVTGGEASLVDGTIRSTIGGASFWFVNPAGITIGPSGAIDVSGAVALGAADSIAFEDGASFFALPDDGRIALDQATLRTDSTGVKSAGDIGLVADTVRVNGGQLTTSVTKLRFGNEPGSFDYSAGDILVFAANDSGSATPLVIENGAVLRTNSTDNGDPLTDPQGASAGSIELQSSSGSISISNATLESGSNGRNGDAAGKITIGGLAIDVADSIFNTAALSQNPNAFTGDNTGDIALDAEAGATRIARSQFTANSTAVGVAGGIRVSGTTVDITDSSFETSSAGGGAAGGIDIVAGGEDFNAADRVLRISTSTFTSSTVSQPSTLGGDIFVSSSVGSIEVDRSTFNTAILSGGETEGFDSFLGFPEASISISAGLGFGGLLGSLKITDSVLQSTTSGAINGGSANACRPAGEAARSTFVRETRGGVAVSPDSYLVSAQPAVDSARTSAVQPAQSAPLQPELRVAMASLETAIAGCMEGTAR
jgi:filamentous hemagglutinin family protein